MRTTAIGTSPRKYLTTSHNLFSLEWSFNGLAEQYSPLLSNGAWHRAFMFLFVFGRFCGKGIAKKLNAASLSHPL